MTAFGQAGDGFTIERGVVSGKGSYLPGVTVSKHADSAYTSAIPEIWIKMEDGRDQHLRGQEFDGIREGHEMILVWPERGGDLLRAANLNTRKTHDFEGLTLDGGGWAVVKASLWKLLTIYLPINLVVWFLAVQISLSGGILGSIVGFALNVLFFYCVYLGWRTAGEQADERRELQARVDELFRQEGWTPP